jgi:hypothetical protein
MPPIPTSGEAHRRARADCMDGHPPSAAAAARPPPGRGPLPRSVRRLAGGASDTPLTLTDHPWPWHRRFQHGLGMTLVAKSDQSTGNPVYASYVLQSNDLTFTFTAPYSRKAAAQALSSGNPTSVPLAHYSADQAFEFLAAHGLAVRAVGGCPCTHNPHPQHGPTRLVHHGDTEQRGSARTASPATSPGALNVLTLQLHCAWRWRRAATRSAHRGPQVVALLFDLLQASWWRTHGRLTRRAWRMARRAFWSRWS